MTIEEARTIWGALQGRNEAWLDAQVRIEAERDLTPAEREAADVLWADFAAAMESVAAAVAAK